MLTTVSDTIAASPVAALDRLVSSCLEDLDWLARADLAHDFHQVLSTDAVPGRTLASLNFPRHLFLLTVADNWLIDRFVHRDLTDRAASLMVGASLCFVYLS